MTATLLSVKDAATILGISPWTLRKWAYKGSISSHKVSTRLMFSLEEIERLIQESKRPRIAIGMVQKNRHLPPA